MPFPIPDSVSVLLRTHATAALAAAFIIANAHSEILRWVVATVGDAPQVAARPAKSNGHGNGSDGRRVAKSRRPRGADAYLDRRRAQRDRDDEALITAMKDAPGATIGDWAGAIGKSRISIVSAPIACATRAWPNPSKASGG